MSDRSHGLRPRSQGRGVSRWRRRQRLMGYLYVAPAVVLFAVMIAYPIARSLYLSFFDYRILEPDSTRFVGLANYAKVFTDAQNLNAFGNTLYFVVIFIPAYVIGAMLLAMGLNSLRRGAVVLRTLIFTPIVVSLAVSSVMFTLFYNPSFGMFQMVLKNGASAVNHPVQAVVTIALASAVALPMLLLVTRALRTRARGRTMALLSVGAGLAVSAGVWLTCAADVLSAFQWSGGLAERISMRAFGLSLPSLPTLSLVSAPASGVLGDADWAMIGIAILCLWNGIGVNVILFLVGLQRIPEELYEASMVDGAGAWKRLAHITLPQLRPTMYLVTLLSMIGALKLFGQPFIMTRGGPQDSTMTFVMRLYNLAFRFGKFELGYASALAYTLTVFILVLSLFARRLNRPVD